MHKQLILDPLKIPNQIKPNDPVVKVLVEEGNANTSIKNTDDKIARHLTSNSDIRKFLLSRSMKKKACISVVNT